MQQIWYITNRGMIALGMKVKDIHDWFVNSNNWLMGSLFLRFAPSHRRIDLQIGCIVEFFMLTLGQTQWFAAHLFWTCTFLLFFRVLLVDYTGYFVIALLDDGAFGFVEFDWLAVFNWS